MEARDEGAGLRLGVMSKKRRSEVGTDGQISIRWKRVGEDGSRPLKRRDSLCKVQGGRGMESSRPVWLEHISEEKRGRKRTRTWAGSRSQSGSCGTAAETLDGSEREREREGGGAFVSFHNHSHFRGHE